VPICCTSYSIKLRETSTTCYLEMRNDRLEKLYLGRPGTLRIFFRAFGVARASKL
jgi:hypothetical protein